MGEGYEYVTFAQLNLPDKEADLKIRKLVTKWKEGCRAGILRVGGEEGKSAEGGPRWVFFFLNNHVSIPVATSCRQATTCVQLKTVHLLYPKYLLRVPLVGNAGWGGAIYTHSESIGGVQMGRDPKE